MTYFEYAVKLTDTSVGDIIAFGRRFGFSLGSDLLEVHRISEIERQVVYVSMTWDLTTGTPDSFQTFSGSIFDACWQYGDGSRGPFTRILRIQRGRN